MGSSVASGGESVGVTIDLLQFGFAMLSRGDVVRKGVRVKQAGSPVYTRRAFTGALSAACLVGVGSLFGCGSSQRWTFAASFSLESLLI